jgi:hypothetical protein
MDKNNYKCNKGHKNYFLKEPRQDAKALLWEIRSSPKPCGASASFDGVQDRFGENTGRRRPNVLR